MKLFRRGELPGDPASWQRFRRTETTPAIRIDGPFHVETPHGVVRCENGWLAVDSEGAPYPIAAEVFQASYEPSD